MWLFTRHGIYSVVADWENPDLVMVRARSRQDLVNLQKAAKARGHRFPGIQEHENRDYRFRVFLPRPIWEDLAAGLIRDITYTNFKDSVHEKAPEDNGRHRLLMSVWAAMKSWQDSLYPRPRPVALPSDDDDDHWTAEQWTAWAERNRAGGQLGLNLDLGPDAGIPGHLSSYEWDLRQ